MLALSCIVLAYLIATALGITFLFLAWETLLGCRVALVQPRKSNAIGLILVPAHNEENVLRNNLNALRMELGSKHSILVVADNCTDSTARIAFETGCNIIVRNDHHRRGKGYALEHGVRYVDGLADKPEVIVVLDADCRVQGLSALIDECAARELPVQARYIMNASQDATMSERIAAFAFMIKNRIRARGLSKMGGACMLSGSGMAFPWKIAQQMNWGGGEIVEDLAIGLELVRGGIYPTYLDTCLVTSDFPTEIKAIESQRRRWEHGFLRQMLTQPAGLAMAGLRRFHVAPILSAMDLCVPPISLLALLGIFGLIFTSVLSMLGGTLIPPTLLSMAIFVAVLAIGLAWWCEGQAILPAKALLRIPHYVIGKLSIYSTYLRGRETRWIRTSRT